MDKTKLIEIIKKAKMDGLNSLDLNELTQKDMIHVTLENIASIDFDKPTVEGLYTQMICYLDECSDDIESIAKLYIDLTMRLTVIYTKNHEFKESIEILNKALKYADSYSNNIYETKENKARLYFRLSQAYQAEKDKKNQRHSLIEAHSIVKECLVDDNIDKPYSLYTLIMTALIDVTDLTVKVEEYFNEATMICENNPSCLSEYGNMVFAYGRFLLTREKKEKEAVEILCKCIEIFSSFDDEASKTVMANAYGILSQTFFYHKIYDKAMMYSETSLKILIEIDSHPQNIAKAMFNAANCAFQAGFDDKADFYFSKLIEYLDVSKKAGFELVQMTHNYYGMFLVKQERYEEAIEVYTKFINIMESFKHEVNDRNNDSYYSIVSEFKFRLFYIYHNYIKDEEESSKLLNETIESLNMIKDLSEQDKDIINRVSELKETKTFNA